MDEPLRIGLRVLFAYVVLHQLLRHGGHRIVASGVGTGGEGSGIDLVLTLTVGDLIDDLLWAEAPAAQFVVAAGTLTLLHVAVEVVRHDSARWRRLLDGTPAALLKHGAPRRTAMRSQRLNESALATLLRRGGMGRAQWGEVRAAYLENSGNLSVLRHPRARPATRADREAARRAAR